ncbi:MAG TPA: sodium-dependent transporter [Methanolinea sp.]|jgi:NSS family neurotransmitter:Na+ symporter|nr:MAG: Sodium:neurotransmitter symporter family protein [Methanoregulaceae archaeon PtaU1.Bin066]HII76852.1 sodium-dependent transporter [Methanolinea sp.]
MTPEREHWSSGAGFVLAAIGSAVGIGNIWRFSAVVGQNGGGAYLVPYLIAVFAFAMPLMILELAMGRHFQGTVVSAFCSVRAEFRVLGWLLCAIIFLVLSYYLVIAGWTAAYALFSLSGETVPFASFTGGVLPVLFFLFTAVITAAVISKGIQKGIERLSVVLIPISLSILVILALYNATLPGFAEGILFLFTPDFSVLSDPLLWSAAFGQAFFSLSVGTGILLTYGAYMERGMHIPRSALIITLSDIAVAILAGIVIFPLVFSFGLTPAAGAELAFTTLPMAFAAMPGGVFFAVSFFLVLFFAALTSSVSMLEVSVSSLQEAAGWSRKKATLLLGILMAAVGLPSALSYSSFHLTFNGIKVLDFMDETVGTLGLPIAGILLAVAFTWFVPRDVLSREIGTALSRVVHPLCRFVIPSVLVVTTVARLLAGIDLADLRLLPGSRWIGTVLQAEGMAAIIVIVLLLIMLLCRVVSCPLGAWLLGKR